MRKCDTYWGSHGCNLQVGHEGNHKCYGCYEAWEKDGQVWIIDPESKGDKGRPYGGPDAFGFYGDDVK